jgi:hypothetical protein
MRPNPMQARGYSASAGAATLALRTAVAVMPYAARAVESVAETAKVRKMPSWSRSWANFSPL